MALVDLHGVRLNFSPDSKDYKRAYDFINGKSEKQKNAMFKAITDTSKLFRRANAFIAEGWDVTDVVKNKATNMKINDRYINAWLQDAESIKLQAMKKKIELLFIEDF